MSDGFSTDLEYCSAYSGVLLAGCDEVGRGPLCGPVVAAAVILDPANPIEGLADSKKLSDRKREALYEIIKERAVAWCVARASVEEIDKINILHASMLAMQRAVEGLGVAPEYVLVDGNRLPQLSIPSKAVVKGDDKVRCISAASILAKVDRDREMLALDELYPQYGFARHKGYPTKFHLDAIQAHGVNHLYRITFGPVARILAES